MRQKQFEGWYFKQQCEKNAVAFIPAHHRGQNGEEAASLQIITPGRAVQVPFSSDKFELQRTPFSIRIGDCRFGLDGCSLHCEADGRPLRGELRYEQLIQPRWDIMGPFQFVPFMQCRHSLVSIAHTVSGHLCWGTERMVFQGGQGYIEGDRGISFPGRYLWTQCGWQGNSVMLSVADIPFCGTHFNGCIGVVYFEGIQYRFATYLGVRLEHVDSRSAMVRQRDLALLVTLEQENALELHAPSKGNMGRIIRESLSCHAHYQMWKKGGLLFSIHSDQASFESEWPKAEKNR